MSSVRIQILMERLRIQSIIQRLIKAQGREQALDTVSMALELEFPELLNKHNESQKTRNSAMSRPHGQL